MAHPNILYAHPCEWPPVGSLDHLRSWTFETGAAIFDAQRSKYGRGSDAPPLSPKSRLVQILLEEPPASPATILNRRPVYHEQEDDIPPTSHYTQASDYSDHEMYTHEEHESKPQEQCYSCGITCGDMGTAPPSDDNSPWFIDIHNGLQRKVAYIFCSACVSALMGRLENPHPGCGHPPSPVSLDCPAQGECTPMFCRKCRGDMGRGPLPQLSDYSKGWILAEHKARYNTWRWT